MTNINCSSDCLYQKDGKCNFENVTNKIKNAPNLTKNDCIYFHFQKKN